MKTAGLVLLVFVSLVGNGGRQENASEIDPAAMKYAEKSLAMVDGEISRMTSDLEQAKKQTGKTVEERRKNGDYVSALKREILDLKNGKKLPVPKLDPRNCQPGDVGVLMMVKAMDAGTVARKVVESRTLSGRVATYSESPEFTVLRVTTEGIFGELENELALIRGIDATGFEVNQQVKIADVLVFREFKTIDNQKTMVFDKFVVDDQIEKAVKAVKKSKK